MCGRVRSSSKNRGDVCVSCRPHVKAAGPGDWVNQAVCTTVDPELFFADGSHNDYATAVQICSTCPVIDECLNYAINAGIREGVWGGLSGNQRRNLTRAT